MKLLNQTSPAGRTSAFLWVVAFAVLGSGCGGKPKVEVKTSWPAIDTYKIDEAPMVSITGLCTSNVVGSMYFTGELRDSQKNVIPAKWSTGNTISENKEFYSMFHVVAQLPKPPKKGDEFTATGTMIFKPQDGRPDVKIELGEAKVTCVPR
ncbi:MAG: hypothetical protein ACRDD1_00040 [Planctomycetia bacterium]